ncbi:MAG: DUF559 domain-containing protein [Erythrobacter sp.]|nr:DUF559 domain-containing protein [Erythrobacter sp.]NCQ63984.1 DUF559 domain-containing protein [Alphaproteobacteria bacterium]
MITGNRATVNLARKLRGEMSLSEVILWRELRKRPGGFKFRRQHPAGKYVLDFYCDALRLAVEVDGAAHDSEAAQHRDALRTRFLRSRGIAVTRIPARLILDEVEPVVARIEEICRERQMSIATPLHHPADGPPPRAGEDL